MNITRLLKIVSALCIWVICFLFIPTVIGLEHFALQMTLYGISIAIMSFIFYKLFREILSKDRASLPVYDYNKKQSLDILISPARVTFFSMVMLLIPGAVITFFISSGFFHAFKWTSPESYPPLVSILILGFVFYKGIRLWQRRNEVVQLRFTTTALEYMPVDINGVGRGRGASILTMYFRTKMISLNYTNIETVTIVKNAWRGDMIRITTISRQVIYLPFLPDNINQLEAVYNTLLQRWKQSSSEAERLRGR